MLVLSGCQSPLITFNTSPVIPAVPCVSLTNAPLIYHAPKNIADVTAWEQGNTFQGQYDRPDTVHRIREITAAINAVCGSK